MRVPTKQIQELCDRTKVRPSTRAAVIWMFRQSGGYNQVFRVDLHDFNNWIGKSRVLGKYCPAALGKIRDQLLQLPIFEIKRRWRGHVFELAIIPCDKSKKSMTKVKSVQSDRIHSKSYREKDRGGKSEVDRYEQQQHINAIRSLITKSGFEFQENVIFKLGVKYSAAEIAMAIKYVKGKMCDGRQPVVNPEGYLIDCLEKGYGGTMGKRSYWGNVLEGFRNSVQILLNKFDLYQEDKNHIDSNYPEIGKRLTHLNTLLAPDYYEEDLLPEVLALIEERQGGMSRLNCTRAF